MKTNLRELYNYRDLLMMIVRRDILVRYKQSVMGLLWALFMPTLIVSSGVLVRYAYSLSAHKPLDLADVISVAAKSVPWAFLISSIRFSCSSLIGNTNLVTKVYFPKEIFPLAAVLAQLFDLCIASPVLLLAIVITRQGLSFRLLWAVPLLAIMIMMAVGIGFLVSAGSLFFRDVKYLVEVVLTFAIFVTPVFYDVAMMGRLGRWLLLNPVAPLLEGISAIVRSQAPDWTPVLYSLVFAMTTMIVGYLLFKRAEPTFAESI